MDGVYHGESEKSYGESRKVSHRLMLNDDMQGIKRVKVVSKTNADKILT